MSDRRKFHLFISERGSRLCFRLPDAIEIVSKGAGRFGIALIRPGCLPDQFIGSVSLQFLSPCDNKCCLSFLDGIGEFAVHFLQVDIQLAEETALGCKT